MVKADLMRDYYADLELQPGASENDIKKQFKKLALKYHPDRNPGREAEVNSKFQIINSAQEVLTDPDERAKYDAGRGRGGGSRAYSGFNTSTSSGMRGNPWSNAGSQWAPPPKPPPPRETERRKPPPSSAGAQRYSQFTTPNGATPKVPQDADTKRENYQAWRNMKPQQTRAYPPQPPKPVPKEFTPQSGREESNSFKHAPPPKSSRPGYDEFRAASSSDSARASPSKNKNTSDPPRRNGFIPTTPGGRDESAASSTSAYSNYRSARPPPTRPSAPPEPPPRTAPLPDPLKQFREGVGTPFEPRLSTPYATHGGEKTNPFENIDINRSKSTRQPSPRTNAANTGPSSSRDRYRSASPPRSKHNRNLSPEPGITRADSDINLGASPKRTFSTAAGRDARASEYSRNNARKMPTVNVDTSSDADNSDSEAQQKSFGPRSRTYVKRRAAQSTLRSQEKQDSWEVPGGSTAATDQHPRKLSLAEFRRWWSSDQAERNVLNIMQPDGPPNTDNDVGRDSENTKKDEPSMYEKFQKFRSLNHPSARRAATLPTVLEEPAPQPSAKNFPACSSNFAASSEACSSCSKLLDGLLPGVTHGAQLGSIHETCFQTPPHILNPFETAQFVLVEKLVTNSASKKKSTRPTSEHGKILSSGISRVSSDQGMPKFGRASTRAQIAMASPISTSDNNVYPVDDLRCFSTAELGSPFKKHRRDGVSHSIFPSDDEEIEHEMKFNDTRKADKSRAYSFSFDASDETFKPTFASHNGFKSGSTENISTKFTPEDWHGKFGASDCFANEQASKESSRIRSGSRVRPRSPVKGQQASESPSDLRPPMSSIDPEILQQSTDTDPSISSPGGTKFTPEEWTKTFRPQNFAPPPFPSAPGTSRPIRTTKRSRTGSSNKIPNAIKTPGTAVSGEDSSDPLEIGSRASQPANTPSTPENGPTGTDSPNAMDIDPPLEYQPEPHKSRRASDFASSKKYENGARNVPVEPSRSDWRAGDSSGTDASIPVTSSHPELPPRPANANQSRRRTTRSADEEDFKTNLEDLKNVEPLNHPATGLHSFADLTSQLPFTSKAAETLTISRQIGTGKLNIPNPPRAPMVPPLGLSRSTTTSWDSYLTVFKTYMAEWDIFNQKMILHFIGRKSQVDSMRPGWLEAFGDTDLAKYKEGLKEDDEVRVTWSLACEKHMDAIEKFRSFKTLKRDGRM